MKPPSFISVEMANDEDPVRREPVKKKVLLLYVDVNITPSKKGRIGIYKGDDLYLSAKNFGKAFTLNKAMVDALHRHLEKSLAKFIRG